MSVKTAWVKSWSMWRP